MARWEYKDHQWLEPGHFIWMKDTDVQKYLIGKTVKKGTIEFFKVEYSTYLVREIIPAANLLANFVGVAVNTLALSAANNLDLILKPDTDHLYQLEIGMEGTGRFFVNVEGHFLWTTDQVQNVTALAPWVGYHTAQTSPKDEPSPMTQLFLVHDIPFVLGYMHYVAGLTPTPTFKIEGRRLLISHIDKNEFPDLHERLVKKTLPSRAVFCREYATF